MKKKVLILTGFYTPSVKGGGPIQSIKNIVDNLSDKMEFYILTSDRDLGDKEPFDNIRVNDWVQVNNAKVFYINPKELTLSKLAKIIKSTNCEYLYLNGFFLFRFSIAAIILNKLRRISPEKIILAPRGEFSQGALGLKRTKKMAFIKIAKLLGIYKNIVWHATAHTEKEDIQKVIGDNIDIKLARNLTANYKGIRYDKDIEKNVGELKVVFVSRIHPKKNLKKALQLLKSLKGLIQFNIYGPLEDTAYWAECEKVIKELPENINVIYKGIVEHDKVVDVFKANHVFLFPTLGENFGHVISEAFIGGCPVIISNQTPWSELEKIQVGWDIELADEDKFSEILQKCVYLNDDEYTKISKTAFEYGKKVSEEESDIKNTFNLFL